MTWFYSSAILPFQFTLIRVHQPAVFGDKPLKNKPHAEHIHQFSKLVKTVENGIHSGPDMFFVRVTPVKIPHMLQF